MSRSIKILVIILSCLFILTSLGLTMLSRAAARTVQSETSPAPVEVILEDPSSYTPPIGPCEETYWYEIPNDRGHNAYLTLNVFDEADSTNWAEWVPELPEAGYYRVEAYITWHDPITFCTQSEPIINEDTSDARYTISHVFGETTVSRDQAPVNNDWLDLGEYYFEAGTHGKVVLTDLNGEEEFSTTVSFSAMRFTWTRQPPAKNLLPVLNRNQMPTPTHTPTATPDPNPWYGVQADPAFDACHMGGTTTMQVWWDSSPYKIVGLYLGGISYPVDPPVECTVITAEWVQQVRSMGWSFISTWVGPQAPCTSYKHQMDEDPAVTYLQGRAEAEAASQKAFEMGLTNNGLGGTIIYYDMEAYGGIPEECRLAVDAFMNGWTERLHELGNRSGAYGSACSSYPIRWVTLDNPPDDVWLAYWTEDGYDPDQTVYGLPCFYDYLYTNHQRIKQYAGGHDEEWGGKQLEIDSNVADAEVAMPGIPLPQGDAAQPGTAGLETNVRAPGSIQQTGWLNAQEGWLVSNGDLYLTQDGGASWQVQGLSGIQRAGILADGSGWAAGGGGLYQRGSVGSEWQTTALPEEVSGWRVVQVGFDGQQDGWLVMRMPTSTIFSIARLLRTTDGGVSWQVTELPFAAEVTWLDSQTGWISGGVSGRELYRTVDGGQSWLEADLPGGLARVKVPVFLSPVQVSEDGTLSLSAAVSWVKTPQMRSYASHDGGKTWQQTGSLVLHEGAPLNPLAQTGVLFADGAKLRGLSTVAGFDFKAAVVQLGSNEKGLAWAVTRQGTCQGVKGEAGFTCSSQDRLWLSEDGGVSWRMVMP